MTMTCTKQILTAVLVSVSFCMPKKMKVQPEFRSTSRRRCNRTVSDSKNSQAERCQVFSEVRVIISKPYQHKHLVLNAPFGCIFCLEFLRKGNSKVLLVACTVPILSLFIIWAKLVDNFKEPVKSHIGVEYRKQMHFEKYEWEEIGFTVDVTNYHLAW